MRLIDADAFKDYIREACEDLAPLFNDNGKVARLVTENFCKGIDEQPTIQPNIIRCKDCKHWRDSDGVYRRGIGAESKCPINTKEVYAGTFYCGYAERRTDEPDK